MRSKYKGVKTYPGILYVKTSRLNAWVKSLAEKNPRFWRVLWNFGVVEAVGAMAFGIYHFVRNLYSFYYVPETASPVLPIIPGVTFDLRWLPHILLALSISVFLHELAHAIASCREEIRLRFFGLFFAFLPFGAFTETEEEDFERAKPTSKLRVYGAGASTNLTTAVVALLLITNMALFYFTISPLYAPSSGILIVRPYPNGPIELAGLRTGDVIYSVNNRSIKEMPDLSPSLADVKPNETLILGVLYRNGTEEEIKITTAKFPTNSSRGFIGLSERFNYYPPRASVFPLFGPYNFMAFLTWFWMIAFSLAIINMLPISALDGGGFLKVPLEALMKSPDKIRLAQNIMTASFITLLGANMVLSMLRWVL